MEKFSDPYGTTAFQGTPLKNFRLTSRLKRPFTEKIKRLRRITLRKNGGTLYPSQLDATIKE